MYCVYKRVIPTGCILGRGWSDRGLQITIHLFPSYYLSLKESRFINTTNVILHVYKYQISNHSLIYSSYCFRDEFFAFTFKSEPRRRRVSKKEKKAWVHGWPPDANRNMIALVRPNDHTAIIRSVRSSSMFVNGRGIC